MGMEDKYWGSRGGGNYDTRHQGINCYNIYMQNNGGLSTIPRRKQGNVLEKMLMGMDNINCKTFA